MVEGALEGVRYYGTTLMYRNQVAVRYYFTVSNDLSGYTFTANGINYEPVVKDGLCYVELSGINPQDWDQASVLTVKDGDGNMLTVSYGPMNYIVRMGKNGTDSLKSLLKAMYNYHLAAKDLISN